MKSQNTAHFIKWIPLILALALILGMSGCSGDSEEAYTGGNVTAKYDSTDTWALYWYLCGSDLESKYALASIDVEEMMTVDLPENVYVVIEAGGTSEWYNGFSADHNSRYLYDSEGLTLLEEAPQANMGDADTLEDFLRFCNDYYPADHQAVIFWNHGGGSVTGAAFDELYGGDSLTLPEMQTAFEAVGTASGEKYELIGFDACLMATIDVAATFGDYASYLVASEELEPGGGWDYGAFLAVLADNPGLDGAQLGKVICDTYYADCKRNDTDDMITLSVVDLSQIDSLVAAYNDIGTEALMGAGLDASYISAFGRAARSAENYGGNNKSEGYTNMVDLGDLVRKSGETLLPATSDSLLAALDDAVVYQVKGDLRQNASGLSCYYNYNGDYDDYTSYTDLDTCPPFQYYFDYALTGEISDDMLDFVTNVSTDYVEEDVVPETIQMPDANDLEDFPVTVTDDGIAVMDLGPAIADQLVGVYINLAYVSEDEGIIIFLGSDNDLEADWENGVFEDNFRGVWGALDGALVYMELSDEADAYQVYAVPVLLNGEEYTMSVSYIYDTETFSILGLRHGIDENGMADKNIRPLAPGDVVEPLHYVAALDDDSDFVQIAIDRVVVTADTSFDEADMGDGDFLLLFEMVDIQNNSYQSEAVEITVEDGEIYLSE